MSQTQGLVGRYGWMSEDQLEARQSQHCGGGLGWPHTAGAWPCWTLQHMQQGQRSSLKDPAAQDNLWETSEDQGIVFKPDALLLRSGEVYTNRKWEPFPTLPTTTRGRGKSDWIFLQRSVFSEKDSVTPKGTKLKVFSTIGGNESSELLSGPREIKQFHFYIAEVWWSRNMHLERGKQDQNPIRAKKP